MVMGVVAMVVRTMVVAVVVRSRMVTAVDVVPSSRVPPSPAQPRTLETWPWQAAMA
jgi:hypothetical protein